MKAAGEEHVTRCEGATTPPSRCRCRCKGLCHGRRLVAQGAGREAYEALPVTDPHHLPTSAERRTVRREQRVLGRQVRLERERRAFIEEVRGRNPVRAAALEERWFGPAA